MKASSAKNIELRRLRKDRSELQRALSALRDVRDVREEELEQLRSENDHLTALIPKCGHCAERRPAVCFGRYEGHGPIEFACGECCGHGNEDGWCSGLGDVMSTMTSYMENEDNLDEDKVRLVARLDELEKDLGTHAAENMRRYIGRLEAILTDEQRTEIGLHSPCAQHRGMK